MPLPETGESTILLMVEPQRSQLDEEVGQGGVASLETHLEHSARRALQRFIRGLVALLALARGDRL